MNTREVDDLVEAIRQRFPTFGGGRGSSTNPVAEALKDKPLMFVGTVKVRDVVEFVLTYDTLRTDGDPE